MQSQFLLSMLLLSAAALATPHEQDDNLSEGTESDGQGKLLKSVDDLLRDYSHGDRTANIQIVSSIFAGESELPSSLRAQVLTLVGELASEFSAKKAEVETTVGSLNTYYSAKPSKPTPKPTRSSPSISKVAMRLTPTITSSLPTAIAGNNSAISASSVISTKSQINEILTAPPEPKSQSALVATTSSTPNLGVVQPTDTLKAAGALAIAVAGIMILL